MFMAQTYGHSTNEWARKIEERSKKNNPLSFRKKFG